MKSTLTYLLVLGVTGLCFVIAGTLDHEYSVVAFGGALLIGSFYVLIRKHFDDIYQKQERWSLVCAGIISASFAITGFAGHRYLLAGAGIVMLIAALLRLCDRSRRLRGNGTTR